MRTIVPTSEEDPGPEVAGQQVNSLCLEAQECMVTGRWLDLASLMVTSADLVVFSKGRKAIAGVFVGLRRAFVSTSIVCFYYEGEQNRHK